jgi:hypothetical protein
MILVRLFTYFIIGYLIYKGILFIAKLFMAINKKENDTPRAPKSKFKDIEEADFTEIKEDKDKKDNKDKESN